MFDIAKRWLTVFIIKFFAPQVRRFIEGGAYYYLTKGFMRTFLNLPKRKTLCNTVIVNSFPLDEICFG